MKIKELTIFSPGIAAAAIPMFFWFKKKNNQVIFNKAHLSFLTFKNIVLIVLMGLFFTGSLAFYSVAMSQLNDQEKIIGWPVFMLSIILASQLWGILYKETATITSKNRFYRFLSLTLLIIAIMILSIKT